MRAQTCRNKYSCFFVATLALAAVPILACVNPKGHPATDVNCAMGAAATCGFTYVTCPLNDTCPGGYMEGYDTCTPMPLVVIKCSKYFGGTLNPVTLCCTGGDYVGPSAVTAAITWQKGAGNCWFWW